ncbi:glycosyltransferase family 2 protein, partial [Persephonella sp.]
MSTVDDRPTVSILILTYNHEKFIGECIEGALAQKSDLYNLEILILDDGSTDSTPDIIKSYHQKYPDTIFPIFKKHRGVWYINKNMNELIKKSRGDFIAIMAGDDKYLPCSIEKLFKCFIKYPRAELVIGDGINFDIENQRFLGTCQEWEIVKALSAKDINQVYSILISKIPQLFPQGYLIKRQLIEKIGGYDEDVIADDWVLNIKIFRHLLKEKDGMYKVIYYPLIVFQRNVHSNNTSFNFKEHSFRIKQVNEKYIPLRFRRKILAQMNFDFFVYSLKITNNLYKAFKFFIIYAFYDPTLRLF